MILCSCNLLTDKDVKAALARPNPPKSVREVYKSLGCEPKCGGCAGSIYRVMQTEAAKKADGDAKADEKVAA